MSTEKIKEALTLLSDGPDADAARVANAALTELEAIAKAAKAIDTWCNKSPEQRRLDADALRGFNLMSYIAKEAK